MVMVNWIKVWSFIYTSICDIKTEYKYIYFIEEFSALLTALGIGGAAQKPFLLLADANGDGLVSEDEFMELIQKDFADIVNNNKKFKLFSEVSQVFEVMDTDGDGSLSKKEFYKGMADYMTKQQIEEYWTMIDDDKSGTITFDEFWEHNKGSQL